VYAEAKRARAHVATLPENVRTGSGVEVRDNVPALASAHVFGIDGDEFESSIRADDNDSQSNVRGQPIRF